MKYASSAWDHNSQSNINKLKAIHRHAARFVTEDYTTTSSVSDIISNLGWEPQQKRRSEEKLVMMYRITYGLNDISATTPLHPATLSTRGNFMRYLPLYCIIDTSSHLWYTFGTSCQSMSIQRLPYLSLHPVICPNNNHNRCTVELCVKEKKS